MPMPYFKQTKFHELLLEKLEKPCFCLGWLPLKNTFKMFVDNYYFLNKHRQWLLDFFFIFCLNKTKEIVVTTLSPNICVYGFFPQLFLDRR